VQPGGGGHGLSGAARSCRRFLYLLYRLRSAGADTGAEAESGEEEEVGAPARLAMTAAWQETHKSRAHSSAQTKGRREHPAPAFCLAIRIRQFSFSRTSAMPLVSSSSPTDPFTDCDRMVEAAVTAASAAAARTSASACASASAILLSAVLVRLA